MINISGKIILLIVFCGAILSISAQSGRIVPESKKETAPSVKPTATPVAPRVIAPDADKYKFVFSTSPIKRSVDKPLKNIHKWYVQYTDQKDSENVIEQLNILGAQGYKFAASMNTFAAGLVKLDEGQYEYQGFETEGRNLYKKSGFTERNDRLTAQGFHYRLNLMTYGICTPDQDSAWGEDCFYRDFFLYEKEKKAKLPPPEMSQFISIGGFRQNPEAEMEAEIKEKMTDGYLPVAAFSIFEIWLQKTFDTDALFDNPPEIKAVRSMRSRGHLDDKVNDLAQQGFRIAIVTNGLAIMYRRQNQITPAKYIWLEGRKNKKDFEKKIIELAAQGAVYRTTYPSSNGEKRTLIMEAPLNPSEKKRDYQLLQFDLEYKQNADGTITRHLTDPSKDVEKKLNKLANEGFVVRDMLYYDGQFCIFLERDAK